MGVLKWHVFNWLIDENELKITGKHLLFSFFFEKKQPSFFDEIFALIDANAFVTTHSDCKHDTHSPGGERNVNVTVVESRDGIYSLFTFVTGTCAGILAVVRNDTLLRSLSAHIFFIFLWVVKWSQFTGINWS